ncbi:tetratricopeptide repeat protein [Rhodospirillaceae bacterium SYSU D60014]|uniref:tetratricopeptide repeat protein n=1 Tax=Virgifigura deserti TaxID=2268457 RepID=UPI000E6686D3
MYDYEDVRKVLERRERYLKSPQSKIFPVYFFAVQLWALASIIFSAWTRDPNESMQHVPAPPALLEAGRAALHEDENETRAMEILRPLADRGNPEAQYLLAQLYKSSSGMGPDRCEATKWLDRAARRGHPRAQARFAQAYMWGEGLLPNKWKAYRWALAARRGGVDWAAAIVEEAAAALSKRERRRIEQGMAAWRPENEPPAFIVRIPNVPAVLASALIKPCHSWF